MEVKVGSRLRSVVCETEVIVVKAPAGALDVRCGGHPMVAKDEDAPALGVPAPGLADGALLGKRYTDADGSLELLVTRAGAGTLGLGETVLAVKEPKRLPSSD